MASDSSLSAFYPHYHRPADTAEHLDPVSLERMGEGVRGALRALDSQARGPAEDARWFHALGLMIAFKLPSAEHVAKFQTEMAGNSVKTSLSTREWVRLLPPLVITERDAEHLLTAIDRSLVSIEKAGS